MISSERKQAGQLDQPCRRRGVVSVANDVGEAIVCSLSAWLCKQCFKYLLDKKRGGKKREKTKKKTTKMIMTLVVLSCLPAYSHPCSCSLVLNQPFQMQPEDVECVLDNVQAQLLDLAVLLDQGQQGGPRSLLLG